jgi:fused signal recognition particle receptor
MFKFLKEKLKSAISIFSEKAEKQEAAEAEEPKPERKEEEVKKEKERTVVERKEKPKEKPIETVEVLAEKPRILKEEKKEEVLEPPRPEIRERLDRFEPKPEDVREGTVDTGAPKPEKAGFFRKIRDRFTKPAPPVEQKEEEEIAGPVEKPVAEEKPPEKPGIFQRIKERVQTITISEHRFNELFWDLEVVLLENNVAVEVIDKIKFDLKERLVDKPIPRGSVNETIQKALTKSIKDLLKTESIDVIEAAKAKKPYVICFVGVNGSGKTTTIAKVAYLFKSHNMSCVLAAADTFRAAAIDQLELHAQRLGFKLIKHDYGSDAAAVAFDAIKHAESKNRDVVLIDTAGRMHSNVNLMDEMKKVVRVAKPDLVVFVGEAITGNDCVEQAKMFGEAVKIDAIILAKADVDEKGGAAISISRVTNKPIIFLGTGQNYEDLKPFDPNFVVESLGLST